MGSIVRRYNLIGDQRVECEEKTTFTIVTLFRPPMRISVAAILQSVSNWWHAIFDRGNTQAVYL